MDSVGTDYDLNNSHLFDWNNNSHFQYDTSNLTSDDRDTREYADPWTVYRNVAIGFCLGAVVTNVALLVLIVVRAYQYRSTVNCTWAMLHLLGALCVTHVIFGAFTAVVKFPEGLQWMAQSDGMCKLCVMVTYALQLVALMYLLAISMHIFFQIYHPTTLQGVWQFVTSLAVHPIVCIVAFVSVYVTYGRYAHSFTRSYSNGERLCVIDTQSWFGEWFIVIATMCLLSILSYLAFVSMVGLCFVRHDQITDADLVVKQDQNTHATRQDNGLLQWMVSSRVKSGLFLTVVTVLILATRLPLFGEMLRYTLIKKVGMQCDDVRRYYILVALQESFYLLFPPCCLILEETGVYSLIKRIRT